MMKKIDYEDGQKLKLTHVCGECGGSLEVAWGGLFGLKSYILRCGVDVNHEGIVKPSQSSVVPIYIQNQRDRKEKREMEEKIGKDATTAIAQYRGVTSLTTEEATKILLSFWPHAPKAEVAKAALLCHSYQLNPLMKHVYLIPFGQGEKRTWSTIMGIGATRLIASRRCPYGYEDGPRNMTAAEQEAIRGEVDPDNIWAITVLRTADGLKAPGYGSWPKNKEPYGTEKGNTKLNMAMIRSERNAFDRLLPGEMPANIEVEDAQYSEDIQSTKGEEVIEGEAEVIDEETYIPSDLSDPYDKPVQRVVIQSQIDSLKKMLGVDDNNFDNAIKTRLGDDVVTRKDLSFTEAGKWIMELQKKQ